jgi:hypothetical protein
MDFILFKTILLLKTNKYLTNEGLADIINIKASKKFSNLLGNNFIIVVSVVK